MSTRFAEVFAALAAPFEREEVKQRTAHGGRVLHYVTARSVMNRLDEVLGPENWWDDYEFFGQTGCKCHLTLRLIEPGSGTESTVVKVGVGGVTPMPDESDTDKTGESDSFKRAAMKFGVGRYLYGDGIPRFGIEVDGHAEAPRRPATGTTRQAMDATPPPRPEAPRGNQGGPQPRTGKSLYGWANDLKKGGDPRAMNDVVEWGRANGMPNRILDWAEEDVARVWRDLHAPSQARPVPTDGGDDDDDGPPF